MGVKGAATATLVASFWMALHYFLYLFSKDIKTRFKVFTFSFDRTMMKKQLNLALPMGIQECIIAFGWTCFLKVVGIIGIVELATTHIIFTIMHASFMPAMGVGMACSTLVSKYMGEKKINKSVWWIGLSYSYGLIDAVVDAHLHPFEDVMAEEFGNNQNPVEKKKE